MKSYRKISMVVELMETLGVGAVIEKVKNEKRKWQVCHPAAVKSRPKPFLQPGGVPACAMPCMLSGVSLTMLGFHLDQN